MNREPRRSLGIITGDALEEMAKMEANSIDTIITDPPYGLRFMGKKWDYQVPSVEVWQECLRVAKPGATLLCFAGTRTQHRMAVNIEDAGWRLIDCLMWLYGQGFPKATDISKQLDKKAGAEREIIGKNPMVTGRTRPKGNATNNFGAGTNDNLTAPATPEAQLWDGWKSHGLKPSYEPVLTCFKPLTVEQYFGIILDELTKEMLVLCQDSNVKGAEKSFSDIQAKLEKVLENIVVENVKTNLWENIESVRFAENSSMFQEPGSKRKTENEDFALTSVKDSGKADTTKNMEYPPQAKADTGEKTTPAGVEESMLTRIMAISTSAIMGNISESTALSWKNISEDLLNQAKQYTTRTAINLIIGLKTLKLSLTKTISKNTGNLYPNYLPIILAMKPNDGSYADNALKYGVGGLWIDGGRIVGESIPINKIEKWSGFGQIKRPNYKQEINNKGRYPANLILDEEAAELLDQQSGHLSPGGSRKNRQTGQIFKHGGEHTQYDKGGGASRFFYCAKASRAERGPGNDHPTVKPLALMQYLCRLTKTPTGGIVLDPFCGSGSTLVAAQREGRSFIGIDQDPKWTALARRRIEADAPLLNEVNVR